MSHEIKQEDADLALALAAVRPQPDEEFADRLDRAVADGFPDGWRGGEQPTGHGRSRRSWLGFLRRGSGGSRLLVPAMAGLCGVLFVTAVVLKADDATGPGVTAPVTSAKTGGGAGADQAEDLRQAEISEYVWGSSSRRYGGAKPTAIPAGLHPLSSSVGDIAAKGRQVAHEAEIVLGTDPGGVQAAADEVAEVTRKHRGTVMKSKVTDGPEGEAGAEFNLIIPVGELESAITELSKVADLRSRSQELTDVTKQVDRSERDRRESREAIRNLREKLGQETDPDERHRLERRIRAEKWQVKWAEQRLRKLERQVELTPVALSIVTTPDDSSDNASRWGFSDAVDEAGHLLAVSAGVAVLTLAVALPIGLAVLLALALNRAWVRRSRRRALEEE